MSPWCTVIVDVVFRVLDQPWTFWLLSSLMLRLWEPLAGATGFHAIGLPVTNGHWKAHKSHSSCSQRGITIQVKRWCSYTWDILLLFSPSLSLWHREECVEGGRDGWIDGGRGFPASRVSLTLSGYLESLLMTRISAPFSSLRRWLSALRSTRTWWWKLSSH